MNLEEWLSQARAGLAQAAGLLAGAPVELAHLMDRMAEASEGYGRGIGILFIAVFALAGFAADRLFWRSTRPVRLAVVTRSQQMVADRLLLLLLRLVFSIGQVAAFALGSVGAFLAFEWPALTKVLVTAYLTAFVGTRIVFVLSRLILAPWNDELRLVPLNRQAAELTHQCVLVLGWILSMGLATRVALHRLGSIPLSQIAAGLTVIAVALTLAVCAFMVARHVRQTDRDGAAFAVPLLVALLAPLQALLWLAGARQWADTIVLSGLFALLIPVAGWIVRALLDPPQSGDIQPERHPYARVFARAARMATLLLGLWVIGRIWRIDLLAAAAPEDTQQNFVRGTITILLTLIAADLVWALFRSMLDRLASGDGDGDAARHQRLLTLLPLFRNFVGITVLVILVLVILSRLGVDIGPMLAGAGVAGIAIGFGAQTLVRDIVSGVFFLLDDAFRIGEYVEIGSNKGTVEHMSLRSLRLRHHRGPLTTVPFGEIKSLTNHSRDWAIMKLEFTMAFDTDPEKFKKVVKKVGADIVNDPEIGPQIIEAPKSQGVTTMAEFGMVMRVKFTARPGEQFTVRKALYHKLLAAFAANGLRLAQREVVVRGGDSSLGVVDSLPDPPKSS
jgi:small-conductance mechanosensitive channel